VSFAPSQYPPPVDSAGEFLGPPTDPEDERIEVGVAIVGGGQAGLACAIRLLQLLEDDPELMEKLGEVPVAVLEKGKVAGAHQLSGAVMNPSAIRELLPDDDSWPSYGEVEGESVYFMLNGKRAVPVEKFCVGPGKTSLKTGEIVVSLTLPKRPKNSSDAYLRLIPRTEMDIAVVGVGVSLTMKGDTVTDARVGLGAVAPTVLLVENAAKALIGSKLDDAALDAAADACSAACRPIDDKRGTIKYRTKIAGVLLKRSAMIARDRINGIEHRGHRPV